MKTCKKILKGLFREKRIITLRQYKLMLNARNLHLNSLKNIKNSKT